MLETCFLRSYLACEKGYSKDENRGQHVEVIETRLDTNFVGS
jgi:hypothetical protein